MLICVLLCFFFLYRLLESLSLTSLSCYLCQSDGHYGAMLMIPLVYQSVNCYVMRFFRDTLVSTAVAYYSRQYVGELYIEQNSTLKIPTHYFSLSKL